MWWSVFRRDPLLEVLPRVPQSRRGRLNLCLIESRVQLTLPFERGPALRTALQVGIDGLFFIKRQFAVEQHAELHPDFFARVHTKSFPFIQNLRVPHASSVSPETGNSWRPPRSCRGSRRYSAASIPDSAEAQTPSAPARSAHPAPSGCVRVVRP